VNEAIWYIAGDAVCVVWGAMIALYFTLAVMAIILRGVRFDWWSGLPRIPHSGSLPRIPRGGSL